ncbi:cupin domain-containing protein [Mangrovimonas sp. YM274]|uniref:cupin domain-containing protein n=1 Tax=Mangrovimonas sp. YM274 TaxID=3070660 RepID=UPI0027DB0F84|nr:cupin domain-containing protein [Mangrovimonas sp. YM274]WMI67427.1 cupin domain-containing protein [Mangrovimonas sp. YM274]
MTSKITIKSQEDNDYLAVAGSNYRIVISGEDTNGDYAVIEMLVPPGGGPPPHSHPYAQELFHITEGELEFKSEDGHITVKAGEFVSVPLDGPIHCFKNTSNKNAKLTCTIMPAGLENLFRDIGTPVKYGEFLPLNDPTPEYLEFIEGIDRKYKQKTYPWEYLD